MWWLVDHSRFHMGSGSPPATEILELRLQAPPLLHARFAALLALGCWMSVIALRDRAGGALIPLLESRSRRLTPSRSGALLALVTMAYTASADSVRWSLPT